MKNKCTAAFLSFVTEGNKSIREDLFLSCFDEFEKIKDQNVSLDLTTVVVDNFSIGSVREKIRSSKCVDAFYLLDKNMFDTALYCAGIESSEESESDYVLFLHDDDFIYNLQALSDTVAFMEASKADCCRVSEYDVENIKRFDSEFTPKSSNPDAIRHTNTATGQKITHSCFGRFGSSDFYLTNWHYTSRPCVWRSSKLKEVMSKSDNFKILQGFEGFMVKACQEAGVVFSTLDKGMMRTFPVHLSARTSSDFHSKKVDESSYCISQEDMREALARCKVLNSKKE